MKKIYTISLLASLLLMTGCGTIQTANQAVDQAKETIAIVARRVDQVDKKIDSLKDSVVADRTKIEAVTGSFDVDKDGKVTLKEAAQVVKTTALSGQNRHLLLDPDFWIALVAAMAGVGTATGGAKKLAVAGVAALHKTGREQLEKKEKQK